MTERTRPKRIPKSIGTDTKLLGTYTLTDLAIGLFPGVIVVLFTQLVFPPSVTVAGHGIQTLTLPIAVAAIALGGLFVYLTPTYTSSSDWIETIVAYYQRPSNLSHEEAKQYTHLERVHPAYDALERTDGAFLGVVQVMPPSMALATDEEWAAKADAFEDFLNTVVEFPIQIFSTTQAFPVEEYLAGYEARLGDADVQANPQLAALIEHYIDWYARELDERRMTIRDHYVVVPVTPAEVQFERDSLLQKLASVPMLGLLVRIWFAPPVEEQRGVMVDALDERVRQIETGLREIDGCNARRIAAGEATELVGAFWAGEPREYGDVERVLRTRPLVGGAR